MEKTKVVGRAAAGDDQAWAELFRSYDRMLRWVARDMRMRSCDAEDAAQLTWIALHQNIHTIRDPENISTWLCIVMRRRCLNLLEKQRREVLDDRIDDSVLPAEPAEMTVSAEGATRLWELVDQLPTRERVLLRTLFDGTDRSYRDTATALSMPIGSVGPVRQRAIKRLAGLLDGAGIGATDLYAAG
jgi:RNA polymerase sigma factor (sigma-70 family)